MEATLRERSKDEDWQRKDSMLSLLFLSLLSLNQSLTMGMFFDSVGLAACISLQATLQTVGRKAICGSEVVRLWGKWGESYLLLYRQTTRENDLYFNIFMECYLIIFDYLDPVGMLGRVLQGYQYDVDIVTRHVIEQLDLTSARQ